MIDEGAPRWRSRQPPHFPSLPRRRATPAATRSSAATPRCIRRARRSSSLATSTSSSQIVAEARADDRHITLRAGENAFDAQSLGSDMVISLKHLNAIGDRLRRGRRRVHHGRRRRDVGRHPREGRAARPRAGDHGHDREGDRGRHPLGQLPVALLADVRQGGRLGQALRAADGRRRADDLHAAARRRAPGDVDAPRARLHGGDRRPRLHRRGLRDHLQARAGLRPGEQRRRTARREDDADEAQDLRAPRREPRPPGARDVPPRDPRRV